MSADDLTHYMKACTRLTIEKELLRAALQEIEAVAVDNAPYIGQCARIANIAGEALGEPSVGDSPWREETP